MNSEIQASEVTHLTAAHVAKFAAAYGDTTKAICQRVAVLADALAYGVDVKTIAADMAAEHRVNAAIPEVSEQTLGRARFAITVAELIGTDIRAWIKRDPEAVAATVSAGKRGGLKPTTAKLREALAPIDKSKHTEREEIANGVISATLATILPAPAPATPRTRKSDPETPEPREVAVTSASDVLSAVRAVTAWLASSEGEVSADLASALSQLAQQASSTRKRGTRALASAKRVAAAA